MKFKIGDYVAWRLNPSYRGIITDCIDPYMRVTWETGIVKFFDTDDLILLSKSTTNENDKKEEKITDN